MQDLFHFANLNDDDATARAVGDLAQKMLLKLKPSDHGAIAFSVLQFYYTLAIQNLHPARQLNEAGKLVFAAMGEIFSYAGIELSITSIPSPKK
jgi:hypothetical protein